MKLLKETIRLVERELEDARDAGDGTEEMSRVLTNLHRILRAEDSVLSKLTERVDILATAEESNRDELLRVCNTLAEAGHSSLENRAAFVRRADEHNKKAAAYRWVLHDLQCALGAASKVPSEVA